MSELANNGSPKRRGEKVNLPDLSPEQLESFADKAVPMINNFINDLGGVDKMVRDKLMENVFEDCVDNLEFLKKKLPVDSPHRPTIEKLLNPDPMQQDF